MKTKRTRGRPRTHKHGVHVRLTEGLINYVHTSAKEYKLSKSEFVANCIRLHAPYAIIEKSVEDENQLVLFPDIHSRD